MSFTYIIGLIRWLILIRKTSNWFFNLSLCIFIPKHYFGLVHMTLPDDRIYISVMMNMYVLVFRCVEERMQKLTKNIASDVNLQTVLSVCVLY